MNTLRLRLLAAIEARHEYFADGFCRGMHFEPSPACRERLAEFDLMVRTDGCRLSIHAAEHRLAELWDEARTAHSPLALDFSVHGRDPAFAYYTEQPDAQAASIDLGLAPGADPADQAAWLATLGRCRTLQWRSRSAIWCYWLMGDWEEQVLSIVDTEGDLEFVALGRVALDDAQTLQAPCFRSRAPLALRERAPAGLQLRAGHSAAATRVVVSQLPAPRPSALRYEIGPNGRQVVSEIFVSR